MLAWIWSLWYTSGPRKQNPAIVTTMPRPATPIRFSTNAAANDWRLARPRSTFGARKVSQSSPATPTEASKVSTSAISDPRVEHGIGEIGQQAAKDGRDPDDHRDAELPPGSRRSRPR